MGPAAFQRHRHPAVHVRDQEDARCASPDLAYAADQSALVEPYRPEYFAAVGNVWREWSSAMAQDFVSGAYTVAPISTETVEVTDAYIAAEQPLAALRRLLLEGRDDVLRALRCQARDRQEG